MSIKKKIIFQIKKHIPRFMYPIIIEWTYFKTFGRLFNFFTPKTFNEKIQWGKFHRTNRIITELTDKICVRNYVKEKIGEKYLIPVIGENYKDAKEIDFKSLPKSFVIKANHGCGYNYIVKDKSELDIDKVVEILNGWLKNGYAYNLFELQYKDIIPRLYIEQNLLEEDMEDLPDYKFFCFGGKVFCSYTRIKTYEGHDKGEVGFFDRDYNLLPYYRADYKPMKEALDKPKNYEKMVEIAEKLSQEFSHVRVDLYNIDGEIYFGEMTFSTCGGIGRFVPEEFDKILGDQWNLNSGI